MLKQGVDRVGVTVHSEEAILALNGAAMAQEVEQQSINASTFAFFFLNFSFLDLLIKNKIYSRNWI